MKHHIFLSFFFILLTGCSSELEEAIEAICNKYSQCNFWGTSAEECVETQIESADEIREMNEERCSNLDYIMSKKANYMQCVSELSCSDIEERDDCWSKYQFCPPDYEKCLKTCVKEYKESISAWNSNCEPWGDEVWDCGED